MRNITYKYNIRDKITFKSKFCEDACTTLFGLEGKTFEIIDRQDYAGPTYKLFGLEGFFAEDCFAGLAKFFVCDSEDSGVNKEQDPVADCDTDEISNPEAKQYQITFKASLTSDDLRAMKKCFFDAMNESMNIYDLFDFQIVELELEEPNSEPEFKEYKPSLEELLKLPMTHINDVKACFEACASKQDVYEVLKRIPNMFGEWCVEFSDEFKEFTITNIYFDDDEGELEEEYCYDYSDNWDFDSEWDYEEDEE